MPGYRARGMPVAPDMGNSTMMIRSASLLAAAALGGLAAPALAQQVSVPVSGGWQAQGVYAGQAAWGPYQTVAAPSLPPLGVAQQQPPVYAPYTPEQRADWLDQCHAAYRNDGREEGQVIGGVLGAVAGGVAGNQIAGEGDETAGTLIGAGVGAIAGAAVGGAVGADADRDRIDECEAYWARYYENGPVYGAPYAGSAYAYAGYPQGTYPMSGYGYAYPYPYPVMWQQVPIVSRYPDSDGTVVAQRVIERQAPVEPQAVYAQPGYGYAYPYPYPVMWVRVPIVTRYREVAVETEEPVTAQRVIELPAETADEAPVAEEPAEEVTAERVIERPAPASRTKYVRVRSVK